MVRLMVVVDDNSKADAVAAEIAKVLNEHGGGQVVYSKLIVCRRSGEVTPPDQQEFID